MNPVVLLFKPWVIAGLTGATAYAFYRKNRDKSDRIKEAKIEMLEMQRTIDRLRAELGRERGLRLEDRRDPY